MATKKKPKRRGRKTKAHSESPQFNEAGPILEAQPVTSQNAPKESDFWEKVIVLLIEAIVVGALGSVLVQEYLRVRDFSDIRIRTQSVTTGKPDEVTGRFFIYKLGQQSAPNTTLNYGIDENRRVLYKIKNASVKEYERSVFDLFREPSDGPNAKGDIIAAKENDSDYNSKTWYGFTFNELSPDYLYEFTVTVTKEPGSPEINPATDRGFLFELRNGENEYDRNMRRLDYLRPYINEFVAMGILFLVAVAVAFWIVFNRVLKRRHHHATI